MAERYLISARPPRRTNPDDEFESFNTSNESALVDTVASPGESLDVVHDRLQSAANQTLKVERVSQEGVYVRVAPSAGESDTPLNVAGRRVKKLTDVELIQIGGYSIDVDRGLGAEEAEANGLESASMTDPTAPTDTELPNSLQIPADRAVAWPHHLVQLLSPPNAAQVARIEEMGVNVIEPISRYALFVIGEPDTVRKLRDLKMPNDPPEAASFVVWTGPFQPAYRLSPELLNVVHSTTASADNPLLLLRIGVCPFTECDSVAAQIESWNGSIERRWEAKSSYQDDIGFLIARLPVSRLDDLACLPYVRLVESHSETMSADDERTAQIVAQALDGIPPPNTSPVAGYMDSLQQFGLSGNGILIGICDSGVDTNNDATMHPDLKGRMAFFHDVTGGQTVSDLGGHGTHVTGIACGNGASESDEPGPWRLGQGIAPRARFGIINAVDTLGSPGLDPLGDFTRIMVDEGAHVMNNSWRNGFEKGYTAQAALVDRLARDPNGDNGADPEKNYLVLIFSAGNSGPNEKTITHPKQAKNPIVVGNSFTRRAPGDDIRGIKDTSSRGPASDGRILPTIVAPGTNVVSARSSQSGVVSFRDADGVKHENHTQMSGTSMAAPHVTGVCALLIEWWKKNNADTLPSLALLKALLVNGAEDLAGGPDGKGGEMGHIPNNDQGWGRVCLRNMLKQDNTTGRGVRLCFDEIGDRGLTPTVTERLYPVTAKQFQHPLRVTLCWTDAPGGANASPALVNDLDLEVVEVIAGVEQRVFLGNVFSNENVGSNGFSIEGGDFDTLNNVECVYVQHPVQDAVYEVRVIASTLTADARPPFSLTTPYQDYAIVIDNALAAP